MNAYFSVCYHYIRPITNDPFPRILGTREDIFDEQIRVLKKEFMTISLSEATDFAYRDTHFGDNKLGLLFTFDDGLFDHYTAARILAEHNIRAVFFVPTCILTEGLPINPVIIHYCLAHYGIGIFLRTYKDALEEYGISFDSYPIIFKKGVDNPMKTIGEIKKVFKYVLQPADSRNILLYIYRHLLEKDFPSAMEFIHLTERHIREILAMGHSIGGHTHSHISVASSNLAAETLEKEMIYPKEYLENTFSTTVESFSYPFGEQQDCLSSAELLRRTKAYRLAFTVDRILNTKDVSPLRLGRHSIQSSDTAVKVLQDLRELI